MTASIRQGLRSAVRHPKLTWLVWAWYGLLAIIPAFPAWNWWNAALGASPEAASVLKRFDIGVFVDLTRSEGVGGLGLLSAAAMAAAAVALVSSAFVFGGVLEVIGSEDDQRSFMHRFFRGGGHFFWRFLRLALIAAVCLALAVGVVTAFQAGMNSLSRDSEWEPAGYLAAVTSVAVFLAVAGFFLLALDYARIRVARDDSRSMLRAYITGLAFVVRRLVPTYGIAIAIFVLEVALVAVYLAYETNAPAAGTWGAIAWLVLIQQVVIFGRVFLRMALIGAERHFHLMALPKPVTVLAAEPVAAAALVPPVSGEPEPEQIPT
jgi:hypothetical protein